MEFGRSERAHTGPKRLPDAAAAEAITDPDLVAAHKKAKKILGNPQYAVSPKEFVGKYGREVVEKDTARAAALRAEFDERDRTEHKKEAAVLAEIFEAIMLSEGQEAKWLGNDVKISKTADYDDIFNHTDMIAEWQGRDAHTLGLAVDVTFGPSTLERKFDRLKETIDKGQLGRLKYVHSEQAHVPCVVIGMSKETVKELMHLWMEEEYEALGKHPIQRVILEQIYSQLSSIAAYAEKTGQGRVADAYKNSIQPIRRLLGEKSSIPLDAMASDRVSAGITEQVNKRFKVQLH